MLKRTMLSKSLLIAFGGVGLYSSAVLAQQTPQQLQGVEITGSRIPRHRQGKRAACPDRHR